MSFSGVNSGVTTADSYRTGTASPIIITGLPGASSYSVAITAVTGSLESPLSSEVNTFTLAIANETDWDLELDYCIVQSPKTTTDPSATIFGRVYESGVTENPGASGTIVAELGYGPVGTDPQTDIGWTYISATFSSQIANDDEYQASLPDLPSGIYSYTYRFSLDGLWYTYADTDGAGSNASLDYNSGSHGTLNSP